ncbi:MAG: urease accessory protein UreD [Marinovum sp.]|nr:urease accessory protein UreD [Marinovum sp.]
MRIKSVDGQGRLADLRMQGASKLLFPHGHGMTVVSLNTSGGVTGGDRFRLRASLEPGAEATITTQAAERFYRALPAETGHVANHVCVAPQAKLHWLPQETILFDGARVQRATRFSLAVGAEALIVDPLVFGRHAMGERLSNVVFEDRWRVTQDGALIYADQMRIRGDAGALLAKTAAAQGAMATLLYVSPKAEAVLDDARALLSGHCAMTLLRPGVLFGRLFAEDAFSLRTLLLPTLTLLAERPLPRTWMI